MQQQERQKPRMGFIGLGLMGGPMVRNVAKAGAAARIVLHNRTRAKAEALAAEIGAAVADSPRDVAAQSDVVISIVPDVPDVEQVYLGPGGVIEAARPDLVCADMSTVGAECARHVSAGLAAKGVRFVDAPVSGGTIGAAAGTLSIMAGGPADALDVLRPVFEAMGRKIVHCGEAPGSGQTAKIVNQIVVAVNLEAVCEALLFAETSGVDTAAVLEAVGAGAAASWSWTNLGAAILRRDYAPGFKIAHLIKDLRLALGAAEQMGIALPATRLMLGHLEAERDAAPGNGDLGTQAVVEAFRAGKA